ncbi:hypothetical protein [Lysobacter sp. GCM10012299]|uniref:hypothetical protein n=1 Tax=Lysobacter sp. GCM10012299 TaxID=3317333 RepID=UPI00361ED54C
MCYLNFELLLKYLNATWSWVTLAAGALYFFRREIRAVLKRLAESDKVSIAGVSFEAKGQPEFEQVKSAPPTAPVKSSAPSALDRPPQHKIVGMHLTGRVQMDDFHYEKCSFQDAILEYAGTAPVSIVNCNFNGSIQWNFKGSAAMTLALMKALYHGGFEQSMELTFADIRSK